MVGYGKELFVFNKQHISNQIRKVGMNPNKVMMILLSLGSLLSGLSIVYITVKRTSPEGIEIQKLELANERENIQLERERERTRQLRLENRQQRARQVTNTSSSRQQVDSTSNCVNADSRQTAEEHPIVLTAGQCLTMNAGKVRFWVQLFSPPTAVEGEVKFAEVRLLLKMGGMPHVEDVDNCSTGGGNTCADYLQGKVGKVILVQGLTQARVNL